MEGTDGKVPAGYGTLEIATIGDVDPLRQWPGIAQEFTIGARHTEIDVVRIHRQQVRQQQRTGRCIRFMHLRKARQSLQKLPGMGDQLLLVRSQQAHRPQRPLFRFVNRALALLKCLVCHQGQGRQSRNQHQQAHAACQR